MHADARKLLWDSQRAADRVARFTAGKTFQSYDGDEFLRAAVERQFEIIGEALNQLRRIDPEEAVLRALIWRAHGGRDDDVPDAPRTSVTDEAVQSKPSTAPEE
jgi:hypothetical protein